MKRIVLLVAAVFGFAAAPAVAQSHVSVALSIGTPHVAGYVTLGRPHVHRSATVIVLGAPRVNVYGPSIRLVRAPSYHVHERHHRHDRGRRDRYGAGTCGGGHGCR